MFTFKHKSVAWHPLNRFHYQFAKPNTISWIRRRIFNSLEMDDEHEVVKVRDTYINKIGKSIASFLNLTLKNLMSLLPLGVILLVTIKSA